MGEGGKLGNEICADFCAKRRIKFQFQGVGARPWLLGRRNCFARGIYARLAAGDRSSGQRILSEVQWRLNASLSAGQLAWGSKPAGLFCRWDLMFAWDTLLSGKFGRRWKSRIMAQEAALK